jgi:phosphoribosylamine--glycine ligase
MKILIIGNGGRERAIERFFVQKKDSSVQVTIWPHIASTNFDSVAKEFDMVIIGPEGPLVEGLADQLRARGVLVFGPDKNAAQLEGSKIFSKQFMIKYGVQTSAYTVCSHVEDLKKAVHGQKKFLNHKPHFILETPYVLKADGLAGGKGVFICENENELYDKGADLFERKILGQAGESALLEEFKKGYELSVILLTNGKEYEVLPIAQDHKRLKDGNRGPNTGGMGTFAPIHCEASLMKKIREKVIEPTLTGIGDQNWIYRGVLFIGLMIENEEPYALEYNTRFGDPETQVILPLIKNNPVEFFSEICSGKLPRLILDEDHHSCCVVLAAENYPDQPIKGTPISGLNPNGQPPSADETKYVLHAGTSKINSVYLTSGGRVLNAVGLGQNPREARTKAYSLIEEVQWSGMQYRNDIGLDFPKLKSSS